MKIAYVTMQFPTPSETFASIDVLALIRQKHDVTVFTLKSAHKHHKKMLSERRLETVKIVTSNLGALIRGFWIIVSDIYTLLDVLIWIITKNGMRPGNILKCVLVIPQSMYIARNVSRNNFDIVHLFWGHYPTVTGYIIFKKKIDVKITMFIGAYDLKKNMRISYEFVNKADAVFTHAKANVDVIAKKSNCSKNKITVVYRGVDTDYIESVCSSITGAGEGKKIACVTRLMKSKGVQHAIDAIALIVKKHSDIRLVIAGTGEYKADLLKKVKDLTLERNVLFVGHISHRDVIALLKESLALVHLTEYPADRLPNVIKEAMCCGAIPITCVTPGITELIDDEKDGYILKQIDAKEVAAIIDTIITKDYLRKKMVECGRKKIKNTFNVNTSMKLYEEKWRSLGVKNL